MHINQERKINRSADVPIICDCGCDYCVRCAIRSVSGRIYWF